MTSGTVAITISGKIAIVTGYNAASKKYPVIYKTGTGVTTYKGCAEDFKAVIGVAEVDVFMEQCRERPSERPAGIDMDWAVPEELKGLKVGDIIAIKGKKSSAEYRGYNPKAPKRCVNIRIDGKDYKGPLSMVIGKVG